MAQNAMGCIKHRNKKQTCLFADRLFLACLFVGWCIAVVWRPQKAKKKQDSAEQTKKNWSSISTKKHLKIIKKNTLKSFQNPCKMSGMNLLPPPSEFLRFLVVKVTQKARFLDPLFGGKISQTVIIWGPKKHGLFHTVPEALQTRSGGPNLP